MIPSERIDSGLVIHHDRRNEDYLYTDAQPRMVERGARPKDEDATVNHRAYARWPQSGPSCTGFSPVTRCTMAHEFNRAPISGLEWYRRNQERDRKNGLYFDGGATVTSSMMTGRDLGLWGEVRWVYDEPNLRRALQDQPVEAGTVWYPSMFQRTPDGVVKMPGKNERPVGGHQYTIGGWIKERGLYRIDNTWEPYPEETSMPYGGWVYFVPAELMNRLIREEGEIAVTTEVRLKAA
jgi:hypothetical protein